MAEIKIRRGEPEGEVAARQGDVSVWVLEDDRDPI